MSTLLLCSTDLGNIIPSFFYYYNNNNNKNISKKLNLDCGIYLHYFSGSKLRVLREGPWEDHLVMTVVNQNKSKAIHKSKMLFTTWQNKMCGWDSLLICKPLIFVLFCIWKVRLIRKCTLALLNDGIQHN